MNGAQPGTGTEAGGTRISGAALSDRHLLAYLFRTLSSGRLVVVATYRADIHRRHPLRPLLAELDRLRTVRRIELARFTRSEVRLQLTRHPRRRAGGFAGR
jgi:hypothetical protein